MLLTLTFKPKKNGTLTLHTNNCLIKDYASTLEEVVNIFFLNNKKDNKFIIVNYTHKFDFIVVNIKHKTKNIVNYFKEKKAQNDLENLFWEFDDCNSAIKYKRYKNKDELKMLRQKLKEIVKAAKKIKNEFPNAYAYVKKDLEERFAI